MSRSRKASIPRSDTHPDARREQIRLFRAAGPAGRFAAMCSLSQTLRELAWRQVRKEAPDAGDAELRRAFASG